MEFIVAESRTGQGFESFELSGKLGMIWRWPNDDGCRTSTDLPEHVHWRRCVGYSAIQWRGLSLWFGGEKNGVWRVWAGAPQFLRSAAAAGARSVVRRRPHLPGGGSPPGGMSGWRS